MKRLTIILTILTAFFIFSCEEASVTPTNQQSGNLISEGNWNILFFFDETGDKSRDYLNYKFNFSKGGILKAINNNGSEEGSWLINPVTEESKKLAINFANPEFKSISKDWIIAKINNTQIELMRINGGNTENLVFTKN